VHNQGSKSRGSSDAERRKEKERRGERRQFNQPVLIECCPAGAGTRVSGLVPGRQGLFPAYRYGTRYRQEVFENRDKAFFFLLIPWYDFRYMTSIP